MTTSHSTQISLPYTRFPIRDKNIFLRRKLLDIIKLFDREAICKGLVEHHHAREQNILFPWLDKVTSEKERNTLLAGCASLRAWRDESQ